jgi:hypothetical protein
MNAGLWVLQRLLAVGFLASGTLKLLLPKEKLVAKMGWAWPNDFSAGQVKLIGLAESLGAGRSRKFGWRSDSKRTRRT